jgi:hypothetical protein
MRRVPIFAFGFAIISALALVGTPAAARTVTISGNHGAGEIQQKCEAAGGDFAGGLKGGGYGCMNGAKGTSIVCDNNGKCKGSVPAGQTGSGGVKGILQPPKTVGSEAPPGTPSKGKNPVVQGTRPVTVGNQQPTSGGTSTIDRHSGGGGKKQ